MIAKNDKKSIRKKVKWYFRILLSNALLVDTGDNQPWFRGKAHQEQEKITEIHHEITRFQQDMGLGGSVVLWSGSGEAK
jgi:alpha-amylase/alpha-mannosidase (GH57 family)